MDERSEIKLAEFEALRGETLCNYERRNNLFNIAWAGIAAIITASTAIQSPELAVVASMLLTIIWLEDLKIFDKQLRIGAYIKIFIENDLKAMEWENTIDKIKIDNRAETNYLKLFFQSFFTKHGFSYIICIISSFFVFLANINTVYNRLYLYIILCSLSFIMFVFAAIKRVKTLNNSKEWSNRFSKLKKSDPSGARQ